MKEYYVMWGERVPNQYGMWMDITNQMTKKNIDGICINKKGVSTDEGW